MAECTEVISYLRNNIRSAFDRETASSNYVSPISTTGTRHDETDIVGNLAAYPFQQFVILLNAVMRVHPANPSREEAVSRLDASYSVEAPRAQLKKDGSPIASFGDISSYLEYLVGETDYLAVIGARGIGKTSLINRWLNHRTAALQDEFRLVWFRIDMSKVYRLKYDQLVDDTIATVDKYYVIHAMYVVLFYGEYLSDVPAKRNALFSDVIREAITDHGEDFEFRQFVTDFARLCAKIHDVEGVENLSENTVNAIFRIENRRLFEGSFQAWNIISKLFQKREVGILSIIDGIDNIAWNKNNREYRDACRETVGFTERCREINNNKWSKLLVVARPETIPEISHGTIYYGYNDGLQMTPEGIKFSIVRLHVPIADQIINKKAGAIRSATAFGSQRAAAKKAFLDHGNERINFDDTVSDAVQCFSSFLRNISVQISRVFEFVGQHSKAKFSHDVSITGVIETVFDNDIRSLLECAVRAYRSRGVAEGIRIRGYDQDSRMLEYMVLGGRIFLDSRPYERRQRSNQIKRGDVFPNIFWFDQTQAAATQSEWHGLAGFRLLKLIEQRPLPAQDALSFVHTCFNYNPNILLSHLEDFIAFGLIDVDIFSDGQPKFPRSHDAFSDLTSFLRISKKGRFFLDFSFAYTDWLYFLALDTPMHRLAVENTKKVRFYKNPKDPGITAFNYFDAFVPTLTTFLQHACYYDKRELLDLESRMKTIEESFKGLVRDWSILRKWFEIPDWFVRHSLSEIEFALKQRRKNTSPDESYNYDTLVSDLVGTFAGWPTARK
jgi:GTPase SAR1 family protein